MSTAVKTIVGIAVVAIVAAGSYAAFHGSGSKTKASSTTTNSPSSKSTTSPTSGTATKTLSLTGKNPLVTIAANDSGADHETINVTSGADVALTFTVDKTGVYHGGLQFISTDPAIDTGPIAPGGFKTVTFTATKSFSFTPYWYASQVKKDYLIRVNVQ